MRNRQLFAVKGAFFSFHALQAVLLPYLPIYFESKGYTAVQIGWLMNIGPFVAVFAQPVWGYLSDRFHTIKRIIGLLWLLTIAASVGMFMSGSFGAVLWFVTLLYFFMYPSIPLLDSLAMKTISGTGKTYGSVRMWGAVGFTTIAVLSGYLLALVGGIERIDYLFWSLWVIPFALLTVMKDERTGGSESKVRLRDIGTLFQNRMFVWFLILALLISIPHRMHDVLFTLHLSDMGAPSTWFGLAWAIASLSEIPAYMLLGKYLHRYHELAVIGLTAVLYTFRWIAYALVDDPTLLIALQASHGITFAVFWMAAIQYTVRLVPQEMGSSGQALISSVFLGLAGLIGGVAGGWFKQMWGGAGMYIFGAVLCAAAALLVYATHQYRRVKALDL